MTRIDITPARDGVKIQVIGLGEDRAALLETFNACADGQCECGSAEYEKVQSMHVSSEGNDITIDVTTKPGETIDPSCIRKCLDQTTPKSQPCC